MAWSADTDAGAGGRITGACETADRGRWKVRRVSTMDQGASTSDLRVSTMDRPVGSSDQRVSAMDRVGTAKHREDKIAAWARRIFGWARRISAWARWRTGSAQGISAWARWNRVSPGNQCVRTTEYRVSVTD